MTKIATRQVSQMQYPFADRMADTRSLGINVAIISGHKAPNTYHLCEAGRARNQQLATPTGAHTRGLFTPNPARELNAMTRGFLFANGTSGTEKHSIACEQRASAAQVLDYTSLNGGPCRDRTYDQLIKRNAPFLVNLCNSCISFERSVEDHRARSLKYGQRKPLFAPTMRAEYKSPRLFATVR